MYLLLAFDTKPVGASIITKEAWFRCRMCGTALNLHDVATKLSCIANKESRYTKQIDVDTLVESFPGIYLRRLDWSTLVFLVIDTTKVDNMYEIPFEIFEMTVKL